MRVRLDGRLAHQLEEARTKMGMQSISEVVRVVLERGLAATMAPAAPPKPTEPAPGRAGRPKTSPAWTTEAEGLWRAAAGLPGGARLRKAILPLVLAYGWPAVGRALRRYLLLVHSDHIAPEAFRARYETTWSQPQPLIESLLDFAYVESDAAAWRAELKAAEKWMDAGTFRTWLLPTRYHGTAAGRPIVVVPPAVHREWIEEHREAWGLSPRWVLVERVREGSDGR